MISNVFPYDDRLLGGGQCRMGVTVVLVDEKYQLLQSEDKQIFWIGSQPLVTMVRIPSFE